jgi:hypothetical protein
VPPQNPLTRIEQVALDLKRLSEQAGDFLGPEAKTALLHWHDELVEASAQIAAQRITVE